MEQHPVPRNISGFQFKLIGDMTVRQFAYLGAGVLMAYFTFRFAPFPPILRIPLAGIIGLSGFAFAFLPVQERPLDKWLMLFIKSITSPTQYLWHKDEIVPDILIRPSYVHLTVTANVPHQDAKEKLKSYLSTLPTQSHERINLHEKKYVEATLSLFQQVGTVPAPQPFVTPRTVSDLAGQQPAQAPVSVTHPLPATYPTRQDQVLPSITPSSSKPTPAASPTIPSQTPIIKPLIQSATSKPIQFPDELEVLKAEKTSGLAPTSTQQQLSHELEVLKIEKERLAKELADLKTAVQPIPTLIQKQASAVQPVPSLPQKQPGVITIPQQAATNEMGLPNLAGTPNLVSGIVKDPQKRILPNVIITIKDAKGTPIRALKTNKLGLFETATPLPNGSYLLEVEDPLGRFVFDLAQITLSGKVFLPIVFTAKGEKEIMRERLTKELFGNAGVNANI